MSSPVVSVEDLSIAFPAPGGRVIQAVDGLSFDLAPGAALGIVGESGSGKSATALALLGLHRGTPARVSGSVQVSGVSLSSASSEQVRRLRGDQIAMIFQDPLSALDPYFPVGAQIAEVYRLHTGASRAAARRRAVEVLDHVGIPQAARRAGAYPHEFSGGQRQRALIAMALACEPRVLVADEPTTALDVTVQAQILDLLHRLRTETGMALLLVTHDLGVIAGTVDDVLVMQDGKAVERGPVTHVLAAPQHDYTKSLLAAVPRVDAPRIRAVAPPAAPSPDPLVRIVDLTRDFRVGHGLLPGTGHQLRAVDAVTLDLHRGETLGVVGESGSGKTTLARMLVRLLTPTSGRVEFDGTNLAALSERQLRPFRRDLQMVFQDPVSSLNPRRTVGDSIADPLRAHGRPVHPNTVRDLMSRVGLDPDRHDRYPHEFSGGQRQRIGIARALILEPRLLVCDEPVSALDVSTQSQVIALLAELQRDLGLTMLFVAHDLAVVRQVSDRVAVMHNGKLVELADADTLYENPQHDYTRTLLAAVPRLDPEAARTQREERLARAVD
jgi:peptide/nickel transport system ATP-binding protein